MLARLLGLGHKESCTHDVWRAISLRIDLSLRWQRLGHRELVCRDGLDVIGLALADKGVKVSVLGHLLSEKVAPCLVEGVGHDRVKDVRVAHLGKVASGHELAHAYETCLRKRVLGVVCLGARIKGLKMFSAVGIDKLAPA